MQSTQILTIKNAKDKFIYHAFAFFINCLCILCVEGIHQFQARIPSECEISESKCNANSDIALCL
jgi:hypothetical protein